MAKPAKQSRSKVDALEWIIAAVAAVLVLGLVLFLAYEAVTQMGGEPDISLEVVKIVETGQTHVVVVSVINDGGATAADVELEARSGTEESHVVLAYSPAQSVREVSMVFSQAVAAQDIALRVLGYVDP